MQMLKNPTELIWKEYLLILYLELFKGESLRDTGAQRQSGDDGDYAVDCGAHYHQGRRISRQSRIRRYSSVA